MKYILCAALLAILPVAANAYEQTLPQQSMLCGSQDAIDEALQAVSRNDAKWALSIPLCRVTSQPLKAQRIACEGQTCKIRFWAPDGQSAIGYTFRYSMAAR
jgi:hypothetical protein